MGGSAEGDTLYRTAFEEAPIGLAVATSEGGLLRVNRRFADMLGVPPSALIGRDLAELVHPDDTGPGPSGVRRLRGVGGAVVHARLTSASVPVGQDASGMTVLVVEDLDSEGLRQREALRRGMEAIPVGVAVVDGLGCVLSLNAAGARILGHAQAALVRRPLADLVVAEDLPAVLAQLDLGGGLALAEVEARVRTGGGDLAWLRGGAGTLRCELGEPLGYVVHFVDVTREKQERAAREASEEEALRQQRLEAAERLAAGVAHDFNNMLAVILGSANLARARAADPRLVELIASIQDAAGRSAALARQLMILGRQQTEASQRLDLNAAVRRFEPLLRRTVGEDVSLRLDLDPAAGPVFLPPTHLEQILMNLATNARDAMARGGHLAVTTVAREEAVCLSVEDDGRGMDEAVRLRLFEPYFTTKGPRKGTGLGMSVVWSIVQKAGGRMEVTSDPGKGTRFDLTFPVSPGPLALGPADPSEPPAGHGEQVVLVEDEPSLLLMVQQILEEFGYVVRAFGNPADALAHLRGEDPVDLLLSDVIMPGLSGPELAIQARLRRPSLPVLLASGHTADRLSRHRIGGAVRLLQKPFQAEELLKAVREVIDGEVGRIPTPPGWGP